MTLQRKRRPSTVEGPPSAAGRTWSYGAASGSRSGAPPPARRCTAAKVLTTGSARSAPSIDRPRRLRAVSTLPSARPRRAGPRVRATQRRTAVGRAFEDSAVHRTTRSRSSGRASRGGPRPRAGVGSVPIVGALRTDTLAIRSRRARDVRTARAGAAVRAPDRSRATSARPAVRRQVRFCSVRQSGCGRAFARRRARPEGLPCQRPEAETAPDERDESSGGARGRVQTRPAPRPSAFFNTRVGASGAAKPARKLAAGRSACYRKA
jgi:hypothetical protein